MMMVFFMMAVTMARALSPHTHIPASTQLILLGGKRAHPASNHTTADTTVAAAREAHRPTAADHHREGRAWAEHRQGTPSKRHRALADPAFRRHRRFSTILAAGLPGARAHRPHLSTTASTPRASEENNRHQEDPVLTKAQPVLT